MTEAVGGMIEWAKQQPEVKAIIASTDKTNSASYSVLLKNNFTKVEGTDALFNWRLVLQTVKNEEL
jgi:RimJ/RimL family protein N-acetyltransferase